MNIFGVGVETAKKWISFGWRSLEDVNNNIDLLTKSQKIGLKYCDEFQIRIPRDEVAKLESIVKLAAKTIDINMKAATCGSYIRGKPDCGDIDILITNQKSSQSEDERSVFLNKLIGLLTSSGFLTDDLSYSKTGAVYMGVCCLPEVNVHRRIDLRIVNRDEWAFALLYFTGSDHFNRSMRLWARKHGMSLSEKSLVVRFTNDVKGDPVQGCKTEADIFKAIGLEFRAPNEREV
eukprot:TRINITY_DN12369_c0_g2_i2.p1 TRINITY_DN12369_c0_g2~~TRINITY_DN12369_c0_g2_i2.p1  ORF type:complete len:247 (-),score=43.70 TRINITY_DN12369_c0_g2_i2:73-774(-)